MLEALQEKYETLADLKARREAHEASGASAFDPEEARARGATMRLVAQRFPGALRQLEQWSAAGLAERARVIAGVRAGAAAPPWIAVELDFHAALRELLGRKRGTPGSAWADDVLATRPPRLLPLVWAELARRHGLPEAELRAMVFPLHTS